jgi:hypothetical protein
MTSRRSALRALVPVSLSVLVLLVAGCGDGEDATQSNREIMNASLADLEAFATDLAADPALVVAGAAPVEALMSDVGLGLALLGRTGGAVPLDLQAAAAARPMPAAVRGPAGAPAQPPYGTYERDVTSEAEPFPGWVWVGAEPADGFVFHFSEDDDFVIGEGPNAQHISGEIRFLHVTTATVESQVILTGVTWEVQVDPIAVPILHVPFAAVVDPATGAYDRVAIGDVDAPNNHTDCYIGRLAFDFLHDETTDDVRTALLAVNTALDPNMMLALELNQLNVAEGQLEEVTILFGCGRTDDARTPPFTIVAALSDFRADPNNIDELIADVTGSVTHRAHVLATFAGTTAEVPAGVDVDGDGDVDGDDTCADIDITFTDTGETMNICAAFARAVDLTNVSLGRGMAGGAYRVGVLRF